MINSFSKKNLFTLLIMPLHTSELILIIMFIYCVKNSITHIFIFGSPMILENGNDNGRDFYFYFF